MRAAAAAAVVVSSSACSPLAVFLVGIYPIKTLGTCI